MGASIFNDFIQLFRNDNTAVSRIEGHDSVARSTFLHSSTRKRIKGLYKKRIRKGMYSKGILKDGTDVTLCKNASEAQRKLSSTQNKGL